MPLVCSVILVSNWVKSRGMAQREYAGFQSIPLVFNKMEFPKAAGPLIAAELYWSFGSKA